MADTLKDELLLGGGICHITATSQFTCGSKEVPAFVRNNVLTRQFFVYLLKRIFNCSNVLMLNWS